MENKLLEKAINFKKNRDLEGLKNLYDKHRNDKLVCLEYCRLLITFKKVEEALILLEELLNSNYKYQALLEIGHAHSKINNSSKAIEYYLKVLNECNDQGLKDASCIDLARENTKLKNYSIADSYYDKLQNTRSHDLALAERARMRRSINDLDTAKALYFKLLKSKKEKYRNQAYYSLGEIEYNLGNIREAYDFLNKLVDIYECNEKYLAIDLIARMKLKEGKKIEAYDLFMKCINSNYCSNSTRLNVGKLQISFGKIEDGIKNLEMLLNTSSRNYALSELSKALVLINKYDEARKYLLELLNSNKGKDKFIALLELGRLEALCNNYDLAQKYLLELLNVGEEKDKCYASCELAKIEFNKKNIEGAFNYLFPLLTGKYKTIAINYLVTLEMDLENYEEAKKYLKTLYSIGNDKEKESALITFSKIESKLGNYNAALSYLEYLINKPNINYYANLIYAQVLIKMAKYEEAKKYLDVASRSSNFMDQISAKYEYANIYIATGYTDRAISDLKGLLDTPMRKKALILLSDIESTRGNYEKAREYLSGIVKYGDSNDTYNTLLGNMYLSEKNIEEAKKCYEKLYESESIKSKKTALIGLCKVYYEMGEKDKVKFYLNELREYDLDPFNKTEMGKIELKLGNVDEAYNVFNELINDKYYNGYYGMGLICVYNKDYEGAINYFNMLKDTKIKNLSYILLILCNIKLNNLEEAFRLTNYCIKNRIYVNSDIILYLSKELNVFFEGVKYDKISYSYLKRQLIDYSDIESINYIESLYEEDSINKDIDIYNLYLKLTHSLNEDTRQGKIDLADIHYINLKDIGFDFDEVFKVITLPNTNKIISMYPVKDKRYDLDNESDIEKKLIKNLDCLE